VGDIIQPCPNIPRILLTIGPPLLTLTENSLAILSKVAGTILTTTVVGMITHVGFAMFLAGLLAALLLIPILFVILVGEILHFTTLRRSIQQYHLRAKQVTTMVNLTVDIETSLLARVGRGHPCTGRAGTKKQVTTMVNLTVDIETSLLARVGRGGPSTGRAGTNPILLPTLLPTKRAHTFLTEIKTAVAILNHNEASTIHVEPLELESRLTILPGPNDPKQVLAVARRLEAVSVMKTALVTMLNTSRRPEIADLTTTTVMSMIRNTKVARVVTTVTTVRRTNTTEITTAKIDATKAQLHHSSQKHLFQITTKPSVFPLEQQLTRSRKLHV